MKVEVTLLISIVSALVGVFTGMYSTKRARDRDVAQRSRETATIISEIGYVKAGIEMILNAGRKSRMKDITVLRQG